MRNCSFVYETPPPIPKKLRNAPIPKRLSLYFISATLTAAKRGNRSNTFGVRLGASVHLREYGVVNNNLARTSLSATIPVLNFTNEMPSGLSDCASVFMSCANRSQSRLTWFSICFEGENVGLKESLS